MEASEICENIEFLFEIDMGPKRSHENAKNDVFLRGRDQKSTRNYVFSGILSVILETMKNA